MKAIRLKTRLPEKKIKAIRKFLKEPTKLWHYIKAKNTEELLHKLKKIIEIIRQSGLRGRGGAGFPTWRKWQSAREAEGKTKYVIEVFFRRTSQISPV